jgi:adenosine kinase
VRIAVTGSIATDYLMTFPGRFTEQLVADQLDRVSLSFLVDELEVRRGGVAANIAFGLAQLGLQPLLVGAVGQDFNADYRSWLSRHGVDTSGVHVSELRHTARFMCTTDEDQNQMASFYTGAMEEARFIELAPLASASASSTSSWSPPTTPRRCCATPPSAASSACPSWPTRASSWRAWTARRSASSSTGPPTSSPTTTSAPCWRPRPAGPTRRCSPGSAPASPRSAPRAAVIETADGTIARGRPAAPEQRRVDPTGVGDAFRAGFLAGLAWHRPLERCAQIGSMVATYVLEHVGTQEYDLEVEDFLGHSGEARPPQRRGQPAGRGRAGHSGAGPRVPARALVVRGLRRRVGVSIPPGMEAHASPEPHATTWRVPASPEAVAAVLMGLTLVLSALLDVDAPGRLALFPLGAAVAGVGGVAAVRAGDLRPGANGPGSHRPLLWGTLLILTAAAAVALDGGITSPLVLLFGLVAVVGSRAAPPTTAGVLAGGVLGAFGAVAVLGGAPWSATVTGLLLLAAIAVVTRLGALRPLGARQQLAAITAAPQPPEHTDVLTGALNHQGLHRRLAAVVAAASTSEPLAVLAIGVDGMRRFNRRHGHGAGDDLLRSLVDTLREVCRADDVVSRPGGDVFVVVLTGMPFAVRQVRDDVVDAGGVGLEVSLVDRREHPDPQLVASELAVGLGVEHAVGPQHRGDLLARDVVVEVDRRDHQRPRLRFGDEGTGPGPRVGPVVQHGRLLALGGDDPVEVAEGRQHPLHLLGGRGTPSTPTGCCRSAACGCCRARSRGPGRSGCSAPTR